VNYRHAFHAGNFADCVKHALLVWLLRALQRKSAPVCVLDTHAGVGCYELGQGPSVRTGEWHDGIGRLLDAPPPAIAEYVGLVAGPEISPSPCGRGLGGGGGGGSASAALSPLPPPARGGGAIQYPGSPALIRALLRPDDRLVCCELHPEDAAALRRRFAGDPQVAVHHRDGYEALGALLPPKERRGLVLIDPPFEDPDEYAAVVRGLRTAWQRFPTGVFAAWYPIKQRAPVRQFHAALQDGPLRDIVAAEFCLREPTDPTRLNGCGLLVVNPPYRFEQEAPAILDALLGRLGNREPGESAGVRRLVDE
jgi:23S rRNA (adenine2030-N6)-methyltransferase